MLSREETHWVEADKVQEVHVPMGVSPLLVRSHAAMAGAKGFEKGCPRWRSPSGSHRPYPCVGSPPRSIFALLYSWESDLHLTHHLDSRSFASGCIWFSPWETAKSGYQRMGSERGQRMASITALTACPALASSHRKTAPSRRTLLPWFNSHWAPARNISSTYPFRL